MTAPTGTEATTARIAEVLAQWQIIGVRAEHDPSCSGDCIDRCPIPVQYEVSPTEAAEALLSAGVIRDMQAAALREAADAWQVGGWSNVLLPQPKPPAVPVIAYSNRVLDWLRDRADRIEEAPDA